MLKHPSRPREGQESAWARYFAAKLSALGMSEAAEALLAGVQEAGRRLPRGVYEKVPGSGDYWIRYADDKGDIRRQHVGKSLAAARDLAEQRRSEVRLGKFDPNTVGRQKRPQRMTIAEMFTTYLPLRVKVRNKGEDKRYADYWTEKFGDFQVDELTPLDLERWRVERIQQVKPATVNRAMEYLKSFYQLALRDGHCDVNPVVKVPLLEENNERTRFLQDAEEDRLANAMAPEDFDVVLVAIHSGLRRGEQFKLRWENVDFEHRFAKIPETKAGKYRIVTLNDDALESLQRLRQRAGDSPWVFPSARRPSVPRSAQNFVQRIFDPALEAARIEDFTWHDLRRTFASRLAIAGQPLNTIGDLMGHNTPAMTKRYAYLSPGHLHDAVSTITKRSGRGSSRPSLRQSTNTTTDTR